MKINKIAAVVAVLLVSAVLFAESIKKIEEEQPEFKDEAAFVVDTKAVSGSQNDYVKFENCSSDSLISFRVYAYNSDQKSWFVWGKAELKGFGDVDTVDSPFSGSLRKFRWFAIKSENSKKYDYACSKSHNDFRVTVSDEGENLSLYTNKSDDGTPVVIKEHTKVIDTKPGSGSIRDFVKVQNGTDDNGVVLIVSAFDEKTGGWIMIGMCRLDGFGDIDTIFSSFSGSLWRYRWFAIQSKSAKDYNYTYSKVSNDLIIEVNPAFATIL